MPDVNSRTVPAIPGWLATLFAGRVWEPALLYVLGGCGLNLLRVRVELAAGRVRDEKFFVRVNEC